MCFLALTLNETRAQQERHVRANPMLMTDLNHHTNEMHAKGSSMFPIEFSRKNIKEEQTENCRPGSEFEQSIRLIRN